MSKSIRQVFTLSVLNAIGTAVLAVAFFALVASFSSADSVDLGPSAAFPGCEGMGCSTTGGRGGDVYTVNTLEDTTNAGCVPQNGPTGPTCSFRDAMLKSGTRTIVFAQGGTIVIRPSNHGGDPIWAPPSNVTIAGQTAPGGGIQIIGDGLYGSGGSMIWLNGNSIVRYMKIRPGPAPLNGALQGLTGIGVSLDNGNDTVLDHNSFEWDSNKPVAYWSSNGLRRSTFSWNLVAESFSPHSTGPLVGGDVMGQSNMDDSSWDGHHNIMATMDHRLPQTWFKNGRWINNYVVNYLYAMLIRGGTQVDIIGNVWDGQAGNYQADTRQEVRFALNVSLNANQIVPSGTAQIYMQNNFGPHNPNGTLDNFYNMLRLSNGENGQLNDLPVDSQYNASSPTINSSLNNWPINITTINTVDDLKNILTPKIGAYQRLECNGSWVANRDALDSRVIGYVINTSSSPASLVTNVTYNTTYGGYPNLSAGTPCNDTDGDGMPDVWEDSHGLNKTNASDRNDIRPNASGYTNLELYLSGLFPNGVSLPNNASNSSTNGSYYVDFTNGLDSNPGTIGSPLKNHPWMSTFTGSVTLQPGDTVYMKRGENWSVSTPSTDYITVASSGNTSGYITTTAYGTGNQPLIKIATNTNHHVIYGEGKSFVVFDNLHIQHWNWTNTSNENVQDGIHFRKSPNGTIPHDWVITNNEIDNIPGMAIQGFDDSYNITIGDVNATQIATNSSYSNNIHHFGYAGIILMGKDSISNRSNFNVYHNWIHNDTKAGPCSTNIYGVSFTARTTSIGWPSYVVARYNRVENIPTWVAMSSHGGDHISYLDNYVYDSETGIANVGFDNGAFPPVSNSLIVDRNFIGNPATQQCINYKEFIEIYGKDNAGGLVYNNILIRNNTLFYPTPASSVVSSIRVHTGNNVTISGNKIYNNSLGTSSVVWLDSEWSNITIYNNYAQNWSYYFVNADYSATKGSLNIHNNIVENTYRPLLFTNALVNYTINIENNDFIMDNGAGATVLGMQWSSSGIQPGVSVDSKNNIYTVKNPVSSGYYLYSTPVNLTSDYNLYYNVNFATPFFDDTTSRSFAAHQGIGYDLNSLNNRSPNFDTNKTLNYSSPAIDAGTSSVNVTLDYFGNPIYGVPDIGAVEYQPPHTFASAIPDTIDVGGDARVYADGKFRDLNTVSGVSAHLNISPTGGFAAFNATAQRPQWMDINITNWTISGNYEKTWIESSTYAGLTNTVHTVGDLRSNIAHNVTVDGVLGANITGANCASGICWSDSNGTISFTYTGTYAAHTFDVVISDLQYPSLSIVSPLNQTYNTSSVLLNISCSDNVNVSRVWYNYNGSNVSYVGPGNLSLPSNGLYTLFAYCNDTSNNVNVTSRSFVINTSVVVPDAQAPSLSVVSPQNASYNTSIVPVTITCTDNVAVSFVWFNIDGGSNTFSSSNISTNSSSLLNGTHILSAFCNDTSNNISSTNRTFVVNTSAPAVQDSSPIVGAYASTYSALTNTVISMYDNSTDQDIGGVLNDSLSYYWNFGDGANSTQANATHSYASANTYLVNHTVTDAFGLVNSTTFTVTISAPAAPPSSGGGGGGGGGYYNHKNATNASKTNTTGTGASTIGGSNASLFGKSTDDAALVLPSQVLQNVSNGTSNLSLEGIVPAPADLESAGAIKENPALMNMVLNSGHSIFMTIIGALFIAIAIMLVYTLHAKDRRSSVAEVLGAEQPNAAEAVAHSDLGTTSDVHAGVVASKKIYPAQDLKKLEEYIDASLRKGHSAGAIIDKCIGVGWDEAVVRETTSSSVRKLAEKTTPKKALSSE